MTPNWENQLAGIKSCPGSVIEGDGSVLPYEGGLVKTRGTPHGTVAGALIGPRDQRTPKKMHTSSRDTPPVVFIVRALKETLWRSAAS